MSSAQVNGRLLGRIQPPVVPAESGRHVAGLVAVHRLMPQLSGAIGRPPSDKAGRALGLKTQKPPVR